MYIIIQQFVHIFVAEIECVQFVYLCVFNICFVHNQKFSFKFYFSRKGRTDKGQKQYQEVIAKEDMIKNLKKSK